MFVFHSPSAAHMEEEVSSSWPCAPNVANNNNNDTNVFFILKKKLREKERSEYKGKIEMPLCPLGFLELCRALSRSPRETNARYSGTLPSRVDANKRDRRGPQNSKAALLLFLFLNAQPIFTRVEAREKNCPSRLNEGERDEKRAPFSISQKSPSFACE